MLDGANAVIANNEERKGKNLYTSNGKSDKIVLNTLDDEYGEGKFIADEIIKSMGSTGKFSDYAVLYLLIDLDDGFVQNQVVRKICKKLI